MKPTICAREGCGRALTTRQWYRGGRFCSHACAGAARRVDPTSTAWRDAWARRRARSVAETTAALEAYRARRTVESAE